MLPPDAMKESAARLPRKAAVAPEMLPPVMVTLAPDNACVALMASPVVELMAPAVLMVTGGAVAASPSGCSQQ